MKWPSCAKDNLKSTVIKEKPLCNQAYRLGEKNAPLRFKMVVQNVIEL